MKKEYKIYWYKVKNILESDKWGDDIWTYMLGENIDNVKKEYRKNRWYKHPIINGISYDEHENYYTGPYITAFNEYYKDDNLIAERWEKISEVDDMKCVNLWKTELKYRYIRERD